MASENQVHLHNLKDFLRQQSPDVLGLIWVDQSNLREQEVAFSWLNYLFNGTLELQNSFQRNDVGSLFMTNQFGRNFFLGIVTNEELPTFLKQFVQTTKNEDSEKDSQKLNVLVKKDIAINQKVLKEKTPYDLKFMSY